MSIFGKLRNTKKAADEHKPDDSLPKPAPYKHVPTHAASDSLACAPPSWRQVDDRKSIQAQYKRRSEMSQTPSGLSVVTTLHRGVSYYANDWTVTAVNPPNTRPPMPALPDSEAMCGMSSLHASESATVHTCDHTTSSESSNSLSSRGSSILEIPPRNPRRTQRAEPRRSHMAHEAERDSCTAESTASGIVLHLHGTEPRLYATEATPQELEPMPQIAMSFPRAFGSCLRPPGPIGEAPGTRHQPGEEGRRWSKNSVYNNIHRTTHPRAADSPSLSTTHSPKHQPTPSPFAPIPERALRWGTDFARNEDSPYPHIVAHRFLYPS